MFNGILNLNNNERYEDFQSKLNDWIIQNGWEPSNAGAVVLPERKSPPVRVGYGSSVFHPEYTNGVNTPEVNKRYFLSRTWDPELPIITTFMMNPSAADELSGDTTVDFLIDFAKYNGFGTLFVINTSPLIKGSKTEKVDFQEDDCNFYYIEYAINNSEIVVLGWGENGQKYGVPTLTFNYPLQELLDKNHFKLKVFDYGKENSRSIFPKHPRPQVVNQRFSVNHKLIHVSENKRDKLLQGFNIK
ncbi:DUF1643 domain-containing protein [Halobacillus sp. MO56]